MVGSKKRTFNLSHSHKIFYIYMKSLAVKTTFQPLRVSFNCVGADAVWGGLARFPLL